MTYVAEALEWLRNSTCPDDCGCEPYEDGLTSLVCKQLKAAETIERLIADRGVADRAYAHLRQRAEAAEAKLKRFAWLK